jgi:uncharacterized DUF497 family protein
MRFEWDQNKNHRNLKKHGVNFEAAKSVFDDMFALIIEDRFHSNSETEKSLSVNHQKAAYYMLSL